MASSVRPWLPELSGHQVNQLLAALLGGLVLTGLLSWMVGTAWNQVIVSLHAILGVSLVVAMPRKLKTSVRTGLRRKRAWRWLSVVMGVLTAVVVGLGMSHSIGLWHGVGQWSALWSHTLLGAVLLPLVLWHMASRPGRLRRADLDRRYLLSAGSRLATGAVIVGGLEAVSRVAGPGRRRFTGSREVASFDPEAMPVVFWINDQVPDLDRTSWPLTIGGVTTDVGDLAALARPIEATIDCTGGWYSRQRWDAVPLAELFGADELAAARSVAITSATGYRRLYPTTGAQDVWLATGYDGRALRSGHGAPVRIVAPGRRGPWWVKWVTEVELSDRPWWLQAPLPTT